MSPAKSEKYNSHNTKLFSLKFRYSLDCPDLTLDLPDPKHMRMKFPTFAASAEAVATFPGGYVKSSQSVLNIKFLTKNSRDLVLLSLRCFAAKGYLLNSKILRQLNLAKGNFTLTKNEKFENKILIDLLLETSQLKT